MEDHANTNDIEYVKGKDNKVADFLGRMESDNSTENYEVKLLFKIYHEITTMHSQQEDDGSTNFYISESIVNRYSIQIRIIRNKRME